MKKSLIKVICVLIILTLFIALTQNNFSPYSVSDSNLTSWTGNLKHSDNIIKKDEKSLNTWLSLYNSWFFKKIEIEDWVVLKWFILSWSEEKSTIMGWIRAVDNYYLITTNPKIRAYLNYD